MLPATWPEVLRHAARPLRFEAGAMLFCEGDKPAACHLVVQGVLRVSRQVGQTSMLLQEAQAGDWLVEPDPMLTLARHQAGAQALTTCLTLAWSCRDLRAAIAQDPAVATLWAAEQARAAACACRRAARLSLPRCADRIEHYLATEPTDPAGGVTLGFPMREWARRMGMTPEGLCRLLGELQQRGRLRRDGRRSFTLLAAEGRSAAGPARRAHSAAQARRGQT